MKIRKLPLVFFLLLMLRPVFAGPVNHYQVVERNCPIVTKVDSLQSLTVGNGHFAFTGCHWSAILPGEICPWSMPGNHE